MIAGERTGTRPAGTPGDEVVLVVDRIACDGYGSCAELLPEMIRLDEWGYPIVRPGPVPAELLEHARMAADTCPVLALRLAAAGRATISKSVPRPPRGGGGG